MAKPHLVLAIGGCGEPVVVGTSCHPGGHLDFRGNGLPIQFNASSPGITCGPARSRVCSPSHFITAEVLLRVDTPGGMAVVGMARKKRGAKSERAVQPLKLSPSTKDKAQRLLAELDAAGPDWPVDRIRENPDIFVDEASREWMRTKNPYWAWSAIDFCESNDVEYPAWVKDYLAGCARRMLSDGARETSDLRKSLPAILGFSLERGRGHLLDPERVGKKYFPAAFNFAFEISKGASPKDALQRAFDALDPGEGNMEDKTLQSHVNKIFGVSQTPRTNAEWKRVIGPWMIENFSIFLRR